ncbi:MAG: histidine kinase [Labilithrix sp.]|nr:histidine kinase [Labilithrix sp.]MCW5818089.1 histidine kinase [Labilithrix sp.]
MVLGVSLLAVLPQLFFERRNAVPKLLFYGIEAPVLFVGLSLHYERALRRSLGTMRTLLANLALAAVLGTFSAAVVLLTVVMLGLSLDVQGRHVPLSAMLFFGMFWGLLLCAIWALGFVFPFAAEDARLRALEADAHRLEADKLKLEADTHRLEADKLKLEAEQLRSAAELAYLRSQLEPHFLLNTLNAIAGLVTKHPKEARRLLGCLGDLLRDSLREPEEMQTIGEQVSWLRRYAEILESRHVGALQFRWEIERAAERVLVPRLLLQPLMENAVNHGALQRSGDGEVTLRVSLERGDGAGHVVCTVEDNGPGVPAVEPRPGAFGLHSVRRRLELKYDDASLRLESTARGTQAVVRLPLVDDEPSRVHAP